MDLRHTGLGDAPNDVRIFFLHDQCPRQHKLLKKSIPDQTDGIYTLFQTKMAKSIPNFRLEILENGTLWAGTYLYGLYIEVPPPPPPPRGWPYPSQTVNPLQQFPVLLSGLRNHPQNWSYSDFNNNTKYQSNPSLANKNAACTGAYNKSKSMVFGQAVIHPTPTPPPAPNFCH